MTREQAIEIIRKEYLCVDRDCDIERSCGKCDLMIPTKEPILDAYKMAIEALKQEPITVDTINQYCKEHNYILCEKGTEGDAISRQAVLDLAYDMSEIDGEHFTEPCRVVDVADIQKLSSVNPQEPKTGWTSISKYGYPKPEDEYKYFLTIDNKGEITIQEFLLSLDEEPQPYFTGWRNTIAWMPLPEPYKGE